MRDTLETVGEYLIAMAAVLGGTLMAFVVIAAIVGAVVWPVALAVRWVIG